MIQFSVTGQAQRCDLVIVASAPALIRNKFGASTTAALVHVALRHGVIAPPG